MKRLLEINSPPIIERAINETSLAISFSITDSEIIILSYLAQNQNPIEIFTLQRKEFTYPKITREFVDNWLSDGINRYNEKTGKSRKYPLSFIKKIINILQKKGFAEKRSAPDTDRMKKTVNITLPGLIYYLQLTGLDSIMQNSAKHEILMPFLKYWEKIVTRSPSAREVLWKTINNFYEIQEAEFQIKDLGLKFRAFLERDSILDSMEYTILKANYRNNNLTDYLVHNEELKKSYIAYLSLLDIRSLSKVSNLGNKDQLQLLKSEQEYAVLEGILKTDGLFQGGLLKEFFPKYGKIEYFFTGMFIFNLMWEKLESAKITNDNKYLIKFIYS
jgi:hypothetical protein